MQYVLLIIIGVITGAFIPMQNIVNATLGRYVGTLGAVLIVASLGVVLVVGAVLLFPGEATFRTIPGPDKWYLYLGGLFGILIVAVPVFLVPRIGATATVTAVVVGQLTMALLADQIGLLGTPRIEVTLPRIIGALLLVGGAFLVVRK